MEASSTIPMFARSSSKELALAPVATEAKAQFFTRNPAQHSVAFPCVSH